MRDYQDDNLRLFHGDCLKRIKELPDHSIDAVITDPPYGTTACAWDSIVPLYPLWRELRRVVKPRGAIVMTASQPFTTILIGSNLKDFRYSWVWQKDRGVNFQNAKKQPLKIHEDICVFGQLSPNYYPQGLVEINSQRRNSKRGEHGIGHIQGAKKRKEYVQTHTGYPKSIQAFSTARGLHPTQKPVDMFEYLIQTYSREGETILDTTMGSGTTGVAAVQQGRKFVGMELDDHYFEVSRDRILAAAGIRQPEDE